MELNALGKSSRIFDAFRFMLWWVTGRLFPIFKITLETKVLFLSSLVLLLNTLAKSAPI